MQVSYFALTLSTLLLTAAIAAAEPVNLEGLHAWHSARAADGKPPRKPHLVFGSKMNVGHVGRIPAGSPEGEKTPYYGVTILQVLGETEILVEVAMIEWRQKFSGEGATARFLGFAPEPAGSVTVIVRGVDTTGAVDGKRIDLEGDWQVAGTQSYQAVNGAQRTVFVLEPVELPAPPKPAKKPEPVEPAEPAEPEPTVDDAPPEAKPEPLVREWSDATGKFRVEAEFRGLVGGMARLRTRDGRDISVPLEKLSKTDQDWIRGRKR